LGDDELIGHGAAAAALALGHEREHVVLPYGQRGRVPAWRVAFSIPVATSGSSGVAGRDAGDRVDELAGVGHSVLEQVATPPVLGGRGVQRLGGADRMPAVGEDLGQAPP
jgi:hypothetical protein